MNQPKASAKLALLQDAALDALLQMSDGELIREAVEDGEDPKALAASLRESVAQKLTAMRRQRLLDAQRKLRSAGVKPAVVSRPPMERIKELVLSAFQADPTLRLAYRDGKKLSETDWQSLYDDLVAVGSIKPGDSDH